MKPFLILHEPEIPFNVGSLIRLSACFQTKLAIIRPCGFPWDITRIKRAVMDYYDKCEIIFYNSFQEFKVTHQGRILSTSSKNGTTYHKFHYQPNDAILMGKESTGLPQEIFDSIEHKLHIPIYARSLNLSLSSAILLSHALQQTSSNT